MHDATDILESAFALDRAGKERQAIPFYRQALRMGLSQSQTRDALTCLGSSLETVGELRAAIQVLQRARRMFPQDEVVTLFLALAHARAGQWDLACRQLADRLMKLSSDREILVYRPVLSRKYHALRRNTRSAKHR